MSEQIKMTDVLEIFELKEKDPEKYERFIKFLNEEYVPEILKSASKIMLELKKMMG